MTIRHIAFALFLVVGIGACTAPVPPEPKRIEEVRRQPPVFKVTNLTIQRKDLEAAIARTQDNKIRLVPVYQNAASYHSFEYRIFDLTAQSVYALLGLQNSDVLMAASGYLIKRPDQFIAYVQLLVNEDEATIEIKREGVSRLLKYYFVPSLRPTPASTDSL